MGTLLSAFGAAGLDPDKIATVTSSDGTVYEPLDQVEKWLWSEKDGTFMGEAEAPVRGFVKDVIIGLGDIENGSNVWNRCALTEEKYNALKAKAEANGVDASSMPAYGDSGYGEKYFTVYEALADKLEESGDTSMRPDVIWDTPSGEFNKNPTVRFNGGDQ